jgi:nucleolin
MAGSNLLGRPLKANLAPPRPGDVWPPLFCFSTPRGLGGAVVGGGGGGVGGGGGETDGGGGGGAVRTPGEKPFSDCRTLFVGNLPYDVNEEGLGEFFSECGGLSKVRWLTHQQSGDFKVFCHSREREGGGG